jgi:5-methyltetrahydrofolate--homocysteine methyltransferase
MGPAARELYENAQQLLDEIVTGSKLRARGVYGFWAAQAEGDDLVLENDVRFPMLRQQVEHGEERPYYSLADFISPDGGDHLGAFAVTAGLGAEELARRYQEEGDDYRSIMVKALADRFAEAFAEYLHEVVRNEWYDDAKLPKEELLAESFRGIRPAFGYPACPDHSEKGKLFDLLGAGRIGVTLTETYAMFPAAAVSGLYLAHPDSKYFAVGKVGRDQVADYSERKGLPVEEAERWLTPNLGYERDQ